jgi:hypothetical protein
MTSIIGHSAEPDSPSEETRMNSEANDSTRDKGAVTRAVGRGRTSRADPQVPSLLDGGTGPRWSSTLAPDSFRSG